MRIAFVIVKVLATLWVMALLLILCTGAHAETITGPVNHVSDGDTITVGGTRVRLNGVDAPELDEAYGRQSRQAMIDIAYGQTVTCELGGKSYDRRVGVCYLAGEDVGSLIIRQGLALDCPRYSGWRYRNDQTPAALAALTQKEYCK